jgi:hypothetical protein
MRLFVFNCNLLLAVNKSTNNPVHTVCRSLYELLGFPQYLVTSFGRAAFREPSRRRHNLYSYHRVSSLRIILGALKAQRLCIFDHR